MSDQVSNLSTGDFSEFPPLSVCIVIDSRFSSRKKVLKDLEENSLFSSVQEAPSFDYGLAMIKQGDADICFIGPSVSVKGATTFVKKAKASPSKCTLLAMTKKPQTIQALKDSGIDGVIEGEYTKDYLSKVVIQSVVRTNPNSSWATVYERTDSGIFKSIPKEPTMMESVLVRAASTLKAVAEGIKSGRYGLTESGAPNDATKRVMKRMIIETVADKATGNEAETLKDYLEDTFFSWVVDFVNISEAHAKEQLKIRLLNYQN